MVLAVLWNLFLCSPMWASPQGFLVTLRLTSVSVSDLRENERANAKKEATSFYYLNSEVRSHHLCHILFARSKLLNSVHTRAWINRKQVSFSQSSSRLPTIDANVQFLHIGGVCVSERFMIIHWMASVHIYILSSIIEILCNLKIYSHRNVFKLHILMECNWDAVQL